MTPGTRWRKSSAPGNSELTQAAARGIEPAACASRELERARELKDGYAQECERWLRFLESCHDLI